MYVNCPNRHFCAPEGLYLDLRGRPLGPWHLLAKQRACGRSAGTKSAQLCPTDCPSADSQQLGRSRSTLSKSQSQLLSEGQGS